MIDWTLFFLAVSFTLKYTEIWASFMAWHCTVTEHTPMVDYNSDKVFRVYNYSLKYAGMKTPSVY